MLPDVELQFQPDKINCLTWSEDGELAIAAGEFIHILAGLTFCHRKLKYF